MPILKDIAQVIRVHEQGNTSLVAVMLGRKLGQFRVHVKGGRRWPKKGFEGGFDLLSRGEILVYPRPNEGLWIFKEWDEHVHPHLGGSLTLLRAASYLCELSEALTRHTAGAHRDDDDDDDSTVPLYDALAAAADTLESGAQPGFVLLIFTLSALESEGLLVPLDECSVCGRNLLKAPAKNAPAPGRNAIQIWLNAEGLRCPECTANYRARVAKNSAPERGAWLSLEAHRALHHIRVTGRPVKLSLTAAQQLARSLVVLVHGALERDLHTLNAAARLVAEMGQGIPKKMAST
jgi:recombinational DNA repair protein (RecF pathway)